VANYPGIGNLVARAIGLRIGYGPHGGMGEAREAGVVDDRPRASGFLFLFPLRRVLKDAFGAGVVDVGSAADQTLRHRHLAPGAVSVRDVGLRRCRRLGPIGLG
jgi:hypothetical protein